MKVFRIIGEGFFAVMIVLWNMVLDIWNVGKDFFKFLVLDILLPFVVAYVTWKITFWIGTDPDTGLVDGTFPLFITIICVAVLINGIYKYIKSHIHNCKTVNM